MSGGNKEGSELHRPLLLPPSALASVSNSLIRNLPSTIFSHLIWRLKNAQENQEQASPKCLEYELPLPLRQTTIRAVGKSG
jgi:hypothetical protein